MKCRPAFSRSVNLLVSAQTLCPLSIMLVFAWLLWRLVPYALGGPVQRVPWSEEDAVPRPSFHRLPVFVQAPGPFVAQERLKPGPYRRILDAELTGLLLPATKSRPPVLGVGVRSVEVRCSKETISVRLDRFSLRAWNDPDRFRLGSCAAGRVTSRFIYFHRRLTECGGELQVDNGHLVYTFPLHYVTPPQGLVIRVPPLHLPIHCRYNRFHYTYKVGFRPHAQHAVFMKHLRLKPTFSLTVHNSQWEPLPPGHGVFLGEQLYFMAETKALLDGERLYVDSCYATSSTDPFSMPRVDIITNYGCMSDSRREGSSSRFLQRGNNVLKFSLDVFLFRTVSQVQYLHCLMSLSWTMSYSSKSCNYNKAVSRWEELEEQESPPSVCACCDSVCGDRLPSLNMVSSPGWLIEHEDKVKPKLRMKPVQADDGREELYHTGKRKEGMNVSVEDQTFQLKTSAHHQDDQVEFLPEKNEWRLLSVNQQTKKERDWRQTEELMERGDQPTISLSYERKTDGNVETGGRGPHDNNKTSSISNKRTPNGSGHGPISTLNTPESSLGLKYNKSNEAVFTAVPSTNCLNREMSCSSTNMLVENEKGSRNTEMHVNNMTTETFYHHHVKSLTSDLTSVNGGLPDRSFTGIQSDFQSDSVSDSLGSLLQPEEIKCVNQSEDTRSDRILGDLLHVKGSSRDYFGPLWFRNSVCGNRSDPADEESEGPHLNHFTGPVTTPLTSSSGSFSTEVMNEGNASHTVVVSLSDYELSSQMKAETAQTN